MGINVESLQMESKIIDLQHLVTALALAIDGNEDAITTTQSNTRCHDMRAAVCGDSENDGPGTGARAQRSRTRLGDPQLGRRLAGDSRSSLEHLEQEKSVMIESLAMLQGKYGMLQDELSSFQETDRLRQVIEKEMLKVEGLLRIDVLDLFAPIWNKFQRRDKVLVK
ncbi:hypothetical protein Syun_015406 [Stephania yunnanensis]|uniref:Uncharacterized protein n=1 Tax=Stephania yunnanensis TaxID=152371 RepID=A0AAP0PCS8_9MAGN